MPMLDTFNSDSFSVLSLTTALDLIPYQPNWLGNTGLYRDRGITTTTAVIESREGILSLVPTSARGTTTTTENRPDRVTRPFVVPHIALSADMLAEDVQNVRAFGSENVIETVSQKVLEIGQQLRNDIETTKEYYRNNAIQGILLDSDGSTVLFNLFTEFGTVEQEEDFVFSVDTTDIKAAVTSVIRKMHAALGGTTFTGIVGLCGNAWWDAFVSHPEVKAGFERWQDGRFLRTSQIGPQFFTGPDGQAGFNFAGIDFFNSRSALGGTPWIADAVCRFYPIGVPGMFEEIYAPADYIETVNTQGQSFYMKQERMKFDRGIEIEVQSNPLIIATRPNALIKGTQS